MPSLSETNLRFAKQFFDRASECMVSGDLTTFDLDEAQIIHGAEIAEELKDYQLLSLYVKSLGNYWVGTSTSGQIYYKRFAASALKTPDLSLVDRNEILSNLAAIEESDGHYSVAIEYLKDMLKSMIGSSNIHDHRDLAQVVRRMMGLANSINDYEGLEQVLLQVLQRAIDSRDLKQQVDILLQLITLPVVKNDHSKLTEYINQGLTLATQIGYKLGVVDNIRAQASLYLAQKQFDEAKQQFLLAIDLARDINDRSRVSEIEKQLNLLAKKVFISYNHADQVFVKKLARDLQKAGLSVWWDEWEVKVGDSIIEKVSNGITTSAHLMVILSPSSVNSSWVQREVSSALMEQLAREKGITILPVLLKDCDIPILLKDIRWADFRKSYKAGKAELLRALK